MKHSGLLFLLLFMSLTALGDNPPCDVSSLDKALGCRVIDLQPAFEKPNKANAPDAAKAAATTTVANANRATTAPDAFASRIHNSYQDFLLPLSFAINKVEESKDGQALIVRFNPIRDPSFSLGLTGTAAKPAVADSVKKAFDDANRDKGVAAIEKGLGDFDDVTLALSVTKSTDPSKCKTLSDRCFGRDPQIYWGILKAPVVALASKASSDAAQRANEALDGLVETLVPGLAPPKTVERAGQMNHAKEQTLRDITPDPQVQRRLYDLAKTAGERDLADTKAYLAAFKAGGFENLFTLIDNQPEFAFNASYHDLGKFSGPDETSASIDFQVGRYHLTNVSNALTEKDISDANCVVRNDDCLLLAALKKPGLSDSLSDKFVFNVSYIKADRYKLASLGDISSTGFSPVDLKRTSEWKGKAQWGRKLSMIVKEDRPRLDLSAEFHRKSKAGERELNRFVATATLTIPWSTSASIPVSLSYANKPDFLSDAPKKLSMHFGLSYRLPWDKPTS